VNFAHNDYLQVLIEGGVIGFGIGLMLLVLVLRSSVKAAVYARSLDDRLLSIACISSFIAILLHSFVDFNMYVPANAFAVVWIAGISATRVTARRKTAIVQIRTTASSPRVPVEPASIPSAPLLRQKDSRPAEVRPRRRPFPV
jgi:O-antigen ligase